LRESNDFERRVEAEYSDGRRRLSKTFTEKDGR